MKVLVTGGGGFLGMAVCRQLVERGDDVISFSRSHYTELTVLGVAQRQGDLADADAVSQAVAGCDLVMHVAARAGLWGPYEAFRLANVVGTENVINACLQHGVRQLVYTSSPSVVFDGKDMEGADESTPYPQHYEAHYPRTKAMAEQRVLAANCDRLQTVSLRPHLVWGPRDTHVVSMIIKRGRAGQLRRIGSQTKLIDTVYVDDAARAHLLAADRLQDAHSQVAGKVYFISAGKPIDLWEMVNQLLGAADVPPLTGSISPRLAYAAAWVIERLHKLLRVTGEPRMTCWLVRELSTAHWFDISAARRDLGYAPEVSLDDGLRRLKAWLDGGGGSV